MKRANLIEMMQRAAFPSREMLSEVEELVQKYPWCSTFQTLKAIGYRQFDDIGYKHQLNLASVYIADRSKLYKYTSGKGLAAKIKEFESANTDLDRMAESPAHGSTAVSMAPAEAGSAVAKREPESTHDEALNSVTPPTGEPMLDVGPLEAQILREAALHLGELEVQAALKATSLEGDAHDGTAQPENLAEPEEQNFEGYSDFTKWLLHKRTVDGAKQTSEFKKPVERALIEKFVQESPQISPSRADFFSPSQMGKMSLVEDETFVTETLARIYSRQGDHKKAARAYKQLSLKYPEKSAYFAALQKKEESKI